jgi:hypothetical protein
MNQRLFPFSGLNEMSCLQRSGVIADWRVTTVTAESPLGSKIERGDFKMVAASTTGNVKVASLALQKIFPDARRIRICQMRSGERERDLVVR